MTVAELLQWAANNGDKNFNIFLNSTDSKAIPRKAPRSTQAEIKNKIAHASKIASVRCTRSESWIFSTTDVNCGIDVFHITEFLGVHVNARVIYENITYRFLVFNIPVDISLPELASEISMVNNIHILVLRRFIRKGQTTDFSPVLITSLVTRLPQEI